ncbi:MAG: hypothetical protein ACTSXH_18150 [Promethearchaeota archaeon]
MSMYRNYLLKKEFWGKKGNNNDTTTQKIYLKHSSKVGGIYAIIQDFPYKKGVVVIANGERRFFNNFDDLDAYLHKLEHVEEDFLKILKRKDISRRLRTLKI